MFLMSRSSDSPESKSGITRDSHRIVNAEKPTASMSLPAGLLVIRARSITESIAVDGVPRTVHQRIVDPQNLAISNH